jgi:hypothetical protein
MNNAKLESSTEVYEQLNATRVQFDLRFEIRPGTRDKRSAKSMARRWSRTPITVQTIEQIQGQPDAVERTDGHEPLACGAKCARIGARWPFFAGPGGKFGVKW